MSGNVLEIFKTHLKETISAQTILLSDPKMVENFEHANDVCLKTYLNQGKILIAGNGGSAADAQHFAGELVSRFNFDRPPLSAIALTILADKSSDNSMADTIFTGTRLFFLLYNSVNAAEIS